MKPDGTDVWLLLGSLALLALAGWSIAGRSKRSRWWIRRGGMDRVVLAVLPSMGSMILAAELYAFLGKPVALVSAFLWLLSIVTLLVGGWLPRWWGPRWYRRLQAEGREQALDTNIPMSALMVALSDTPEVRSAQQAEERFAGSALLGSWRGGFVYDPDTKERVHGMARRGTVDGRLFAYQDGVVFAASTWEDNLRGEPMVVAIEADQITDVRVVPPRAGADGVQRRGWAYRAWFPRVVVGTVERAYVFDVSWGRARRVAEALKPLTVHK